MNKLLLSPNTIVSKIKKKSCLCMNEYLCYSTFNLTTLTSLGPLKFNIVTLSAI